MHTSRIVCCVVYWSWWSLRTKIVCRFLFKEKFDDTKEAVNRGRTDEAINRGRTDITMEERTKQQPRKERHYNGGKNKTKNIDLQNTTQKTKYWGIQTSLIPGESSNIDLQNTTQKTKYWGIQTSLKPDKSSNIDLLNTTQKTKYWGIQPSLKPGENSFAQLKINKMINKYRTMSDKFYCKEAYGCKWTW